MSLSLARRADLFPDRTAVVDVSEDDLYAPARTIDEDRVSYATLSRLADALATRLATLGVDPGDTVCLLSRNRVTSLALLFACRRLEATLAPISHLLTPVTVERPFDALEPTLLVAEPAQRDLRRSLPVDSVVTIDELATVESESDPDPNPSPNPNRPLLALHGEDGRPVVAYSERALERNCLTAVVAWGCSGSDTVSLLAPLSTPDSLARVALPTLYVGGRLLLDRAFDPGDAVTAMDCERATLAAGRPGALRDLATDPGFDEAVDALERVVVSGSLADDVRTAFSNRGISIYRAWGRLECPTAFTRLIGGESEVQQNHDHEDAIGVPVPDCYVRLVDDGDLIEGAGAGRLELSGPVLASGYLTDGSRGNRPSDRLDRTAESDDAGRFGDADDRGWSDDLDDAGQFDDWFDTGMRARRDESGRYSLDHSR
ncbi:AMP-binding protein [Natrarchaeobaculum aegyptiacum]|uniref:AMP-dependent synthetase n=1 Tax=Natrarchaeobaculum aegyptiacum TaxID=745377 RepID=A0A2Z2HXL4_9EURY|nr:class I adenylate-forming enzyme family protein [Natrarchaeobaculum aegyptiacum]ARS89724.1 AMP-dependent synthetase [Natrarchaeobaculum aegyptiacum]